MNTASKTKSNPKAAFLELEAIGVPVIARGVKGLETVVSECEANARLIAAAPEQHAELEHGVETIDYCIKWTAQARNIAANVNSQATVDMLGVVVNNLTNLRISHLAAIAKATGQL